MSYNIKKYTLIGAIFIVIAFLSCVLIWSSISSDTANAVYLESNTTFTLNFPYNNNNSSLIDYNLFGAYGGSISNNVAVNGSTNYYFSNGQRIYKLSNGESDSSLDYATITTKKVVFGNSTYYLNWIIDLFYDRGNTNNLNFFIDYNYNFLANTTYTISLMTFLNIDYTYNNDIYGFNYNDGSSTTFRVNRSDLVNNGATFTDSNGLDFACYYFTFTPSTNMSYIRFYSNTNYNLFGVFLNIGSNPTYYLSSQVEFTGSFTGVLSSEYSETLNNNNYIYGTTANDSIFTADSVLYNYDYLYNNFYVNSAYNYFTISYDVSLNGGSYYHTYLVMSASTFTSDLGFNIIKFSPIGNMPTATVEKVAIEIDNNNAIYVSFEDTRLPFTLKNVSIKLLANSLYNFATYYNQGYNEAKDYYNSYYENLYNINMNNEYSRGKNDGLSMAEDSSFIGLMSAVIESPLNAVLGLFDFEILGYNMKAFYLSLISLALVLFCIKFITGNLGGKND